MAKFYVYELIRPDGRVFYVGKGTGRRIFDHEREARNGCACHKCCTIRKIWEDGGEVCRSFVFHTDDEHEALAHEIRLIAQYGRNNLCNQTDGGDGLSGYKPSPATTEKIRISLRKAFADPVVKEKMRAAGKRLFADPEHRRRNAELVRKGMTPEVRARMSELAKQRLADPIERERLQAAQRAGQLVSKKPNPSTRPEVREKQRAAALRREADPQYREAKRQRMASPELRKRLAASVKASLSTPEIKARRSELAKALWADPAKRAELCEKLKAAKARKRAEREAAKQER